MIAGIQLQGAGNYGYRSFTKSPYAVAHSVGFASRSKISLPTVVSLPSAKPGRPVEPVSIVKKTAAIQNIQDQPLDKTAIMRRWETDPAAAIVRSRIQYGGDAIPENAVVGLGLDKNGGIDKAEIPAFSLPGASADEEVSPGQALPEQDFPGIGRTSLNLPGADRTADKKNADGLNDKALVKNAVSKKSKTAQDVMEESECQTCKNRKYQDGSDDPGVSFKTPTKMSPEQAASKVRGHEMEHVTREQARAQREGRKVVSQSVTYHTDICPECGRVYISGGTTRTTTAAVTEDESQPEENVPYTNGIMAA